MTNEVDIGPPPYANDRERELAIGLFRQLQALDNAPARMTLISKALAAYRIELASTFNALPADEIWYALEAAMSADLVPAHDGGSEDDP